MPLGQELDRARCDAMLGMDVPWLLDQWASRTPDKPFFFWEPFEGVPATFTYAEFRARARSMAHGLQLRGIARGDFLLLHMENSPEFLITWFACAILGVVAVSTNTRSVGPDLAYFAAHTRAACAVTQPAFARLIHEACPDLGFVVSTDNDAGRPTDLPADIPLVAFSDLMRSDGEPPSHSADPTANLGIQFTSGTTSRPKAVLWTHANGVWAGMVSASHMHLRHDDIALIYLPLFHTNAQAYSMLATLWCGGSFVLQPKFSASRFWDVSTRHRVTWLSTIPFTIKALEPHPVPSHHYRFWGASTHMAAVADRLGITSLGWWGMTETLTHGIVSDFHHPGPDQSIGRAAPEYALQIRKADGSIAGPGERGRLYIRGVRGVSLFKEYYRDPVATEKAFDQNGWFDTGDVVEIGEDGPLFFSDRDKDMLRVGGENVAASEVEAAVLRSGWVAECAVVGEPHAMLDEVPVAFVVPHAPLTDDLEDRIIRHCRLNLADFKVPRAIHVVDGLPRGLLDKVSKVQLRAMLDPQASKLPGKPPAASRP